MKNIQYNILFLIILGIITFSNYRVFKSYKEQLPLLADFNYRQGDPALPIEVIEKFQHSYPNINNTVIPIELLKANYYVRDNNLDKTLEYVDNGSKKNPYLYIGEFQKGRLYFKLGKKDSAYFYLKKAAQGLPKNQSHITHFQLSLGQLEKLDELDSLFNLKKSFAEEAIWQNQVYFNSSIKLYKGIPFSKLDSLNAEEAIKKYPKNKVMRIAYQTIFSGLDKISSANLYDKEANSLYESKDYDGSIKFWKKAIEIIPNDQAYYFNIARSLTLKKNFKSSDSLLRELMGKDFLVDNGELEFLLAMNIIDEPEKYKFKICNLLEVSNEKGYELSKNISKQLKCN